MTPRPQETAQLARLRALRVERAQQQVTDAQRALLAAEQAVQARRDAIAQGLAALDALDAAIRGELASRIGRWAAIATAERDRLLDRIERDEYALDEDERALEQAIDALRAARVALGQARAREDVVRGIAADARRLHRAAIEARAEAELEDRVARSPS